MKTILVPTDGSIAAEKALDLALDLARQHGARLKLLHVLLRDKEAEQLLRLPDVAALGADVVGALKRLQSGPVAARAAEDVMRDPDAPGHPAPEPLLRMIGAHVLARAAARAKAAHVAADVLAVADGPIGKSILDAADAAGADGIVMGTRGLSRVETVAFGSVSQDVCRGAKCTCVAVH